MRIAKSLFLVASPRHLRGKCSKELFITFHRFTLSAIFWPSTTRAISFSDVSRMSFSIQHTQEGVAVCGRSRPARVKLGHNRVQLTGKGPFFTAASLVKDPHLVRPKLLRNTHWPKIHKGNPFRPAQLSGALCPESLFHTATSQTKERTYRYCELLRLSWSSSYEQERLLRKCGTHKYSGDWR